MRLERKSDPREVWGDNDRTIVKQNALPHTPNGELTTCAPAHHHPRHRAAAAGRAAARRPFRHAAARRPCRHGRRGARSRRRAGAGHGRRRRRRAGG
eukprot:scaffold142948_cov151-Phaeocystis_antarctica.AAC.3